MLRLLLVVVSCARLSHVTSVQHCLVSHARYGALALTSGPHGMTSSYCNKSRDWQHHRHLRNEQVSSLEQDGIHVRPTIACNLSNATPQSV
ncbi:uncharacterized protein B0T15DRAFT_183378 [Chaetomium strumarium]|uniref:Secreted protein n=1 Tax=Chaetomium strumarium TaxID=1170767 RepID=A0AAJ0GXC2_9PEZI|nr:hypothetical protein B0T15DRAFT_183378 [Chaetomium strumarium]